MKKIIVCIYPVGMCNQLFMYAYGRYVQEKNGGELYLSYVGCEQAEHGATWDNCLAHFNLHLQGIIREKSILIRVCGWRYIVNRIIAKIKFKKGRGEYGKIGKIIKSLGIIVNSTAATRNDEHYYDIIPNSNIIYCEGFFQNTLIVNEIIYKLQQEITLKEDSIPSDNDYEYIKTQMKNENSVAIHIRRGDYLNYPDMQVCDDNYYCKAIKIINTKVENPHFYVFSDDINYVKKMLIDYKENISYISGEQRDYEELMLMRNCKNFIISNSSFSYWGQFLSENPNKIVIAPNRWFLSKEEGSNPFKEQNWILL